MTNSCKNICHRLRASFTHGRLRYVDGHKYCAMCEVYFKTDELRCVCCKARLRVKPRNHKSKIMYRQYMGSD